MADVQCLLTRRLGHGGLFKSNSRCRFLHLGVHFGSFPRRKQDRRAQYVGETFPGGGAALAGVGTLCVEHWAGESAQSRLDV